MKMLARKKSKKYKLSLQHHPDRGGDEMFKKISTAYDV